MSHISSRTRSRLSVSQNHYTITLRSTIRGLQGLTISIPRLDSTESTETMSETTDLETEDSNQIEFSEDVASCTILKKLNQFYVNKRTCPIDDCAICLDGFKAKQRCRELPCGHIFHKKCVDRWLKKNPRCPICRHCLQTEQPISNVRVLRPRSSRNTLMD